MQSKSLKQRFIHSPNQRIRKRPDFERLQRSGQRYHSRDFVYLVAAAGGASSRLGVTVTTKVEPNAVGRNRIKRCLREVFRLHRDQLTAYFDIVVIARQNAPRCSYAEIRKQFVGALRYHGCLA